MQQGSKDTIGMSAYDAKLRKSQPIHPRTENNAPDVTSSSAQGTDDGNVNAKRQAQVGQWQTPPHMLFPAVDAASTMKNSTTASFNEAVTAPIMANIAIPKEIFKGANPSDYPALEEAYRRGAAAAVAFSQATMAAQKQSQVKVTDNKGSLTNVSEGLPAMSLLNPPDQTMSMPTISAPRSTSAMKSNNSSRANTANEHLKVKIESNESQGIPSNATVLHPAGQWLMNNQVSRSVSLPTDMNTYNNNAENGDQEEEKRQKRLARNRASARLRRLRKKNLVESYEHEVGVLESSLDKLKAHSWGSGNCEALIQALSMERGQQHLSESDRRKWIVGLIKQQRDQIENLMETHIETMMLSWIGKISQGQVSVSDGSEEAKLAAELSDVLQLTAEQQESLSSLDSGEEELKAIQTIDVCLEAMMNNGWLMNDGVEEVTEQFASILNPSQMSKFMIWTDQNSDAIDCLEYVNAPRALDPPAKHPIFVFGVDQGEDDPDVKNVDH